jgi:hypothetical protein
MIDVNTRANAKAKGKRPWFFENRDAEKVLNITMALAQELAVTRERLDTLEQLLQAKGVLSTSEFDRYVPNKALSEQRSASQQAYLARVLRVISQEIAAIPEAIHEASAADAPEASSDLSGDVSIEELANH